MKVKIAIVLISLFIPFGVNSQDLRGDVDHNRQVNINDVTCLIDFLLQGSWPVDTSGNSGAETHAIQLQMQGGMMENGFAVGNITKITQFTRYRHSVLMMNVENCSVVNIHTDSDESLTIFLYDEHGDYIGSVSTVEKIPADASFVKFMLYKSSDYTSVPNLEVLIKGNSTFWKNDVPERVTKKFFSFETTMPRGQNSDSQQEDSTSSAVINQRLYDNGFVKLPPNYSREGDAVPLVVFVHGTGGYSFGSGPTSNGGAGDYNALQDFIVNNGYALCDCSGSTYSYRNVQNAFAAPSFKQCIIDMVKYLLANYNIKDDGIYIYGKSSGGFITHMMALDSVIEVKAVGSLAPALSPMVSIAHHARTYTSTANMVAEQIGVDHTFMPGEFDSEDQAAILENINLWRQIDPFFSGTDFTDAQVARIVSLCYAAGGNSYHLNISDIPEAVEMCNSAKRWVPCPTEIWIAEDDHVVFYGNSKLFVEMAQRTGSPCYLRTMPAGTGKHHAVDTDENALKVDYITKYAGVVEVPVAYAELVDWFNRW